MQADDVWLDAAIGFGAAKVLATVAQVAWPGGARALTGSRLGRLLYVVGKVTPIGLVAALLMRALRSGSSDAVPLAWSLLGVCLLVALVVALRLKGRWFGLAHMLKSHRGDTRR